MCKDALNSDVQHAKGVLMSTKISFVASTANTQAIPSWAWKEGDDTTHIAESEELKSLLMKVKEESEKLA